MVDRQPELGLVDLLLGPVFAKPKRWELALLRVPWLRHRIAMRVLLRARKEGYRRG